VNKAGDDLVADKIHTIRQNYAFWKKFEGKDIEIFTWNGKPYQKGSTQKAVCVKRIVSVQKICLWHNRLRVFRGYKPMSEFYIEKIWNNEALYLDNEILAKNDGFENADEFSDWFYDYPDGEMGVVHFTELRYGNERMRIGAIPETATPGCGSTSL
jgi:hypothetical protein